MNKTTSLQLDDETTKKTQENLKLCTNQLFK